MAISCSSPFSDWAGVATSAGARFSLAMALVESSASSPLPNHALTLKLSLLVII